MSRTFFSFPFVGTTVLLAATVGLSGVVERRIPESLHMPLQEITRSISGWSAISEQTLDAAALRQLLPTSYLVRTYRKKDTSLELFIAYYSQQRAGESMHSPRHCLPGGGWEIWKHDTVSVPVADKRVVINKYSIQNNGSRLLMFYWYQSRDRIFANEYLGKVLLARDTLLTGRTAGSIVRISLPDVPGSTEEAVRFAQEVIPQVHRCFGGS